MNITGYDGVDVFIGVDVGKGEHHAVAVDRAGKRLFDKALPNEETKLRELIRGLKDRGTVLFVVDQPATIGALPLAVAQAENVLIGYLPGLAMRRIADLHAGEAKTDRRDAAIIAEAARTLPHALRSLALADEQVAELSMLCGFDDDLAQQINATGNRIRGLLTQIHPTLERVIGKHLDHPAIVDLLQRYPSPAALAAAGEKRLGDRLSKLAPRIGRRLAAGIVQALSEQTVVVVGTNAAALVLPRLAKQLADLRQQRDDIAVEVERLVEAHPLHPVLTSMPGVGVRTTARLLTEVAGKSFATAAHLASYAGLAPVTRRSGSSIRGEHASRRGNKLLKRALFLSAFAALRDPVSRAYYDRKIAQGKRHNEALIALARRRCDVLHAMIRDGSLYHPRTPLPATAA
ncbi:IS110 family transposase [Rathayibacter iranicus]|uniref:IS110 family transposase n=5 Tax=Rathayibacter iranicus TaxID=59737 RepID=A0AAD1AGK8_9MICO|nr:IS110 family transposase [Rathayibacter iranicus]AZZ54867.1 IS110 family transposase [Rathayibacter iranicus]AZZ55080.1 IS110 family transposase [Rathayibacter iranicus]AZZ56865.1 IS110 family transposase [Rathayibacter iranicus]AZZ56875.1 IS110 family transposase [Rathayibacter iranicus]MWV31442.1 IS110 family transposase [Rathayibacter iranicus NCPPB 2253 = VKM Ac-1602]